jgi:hypothetical protein
MLLPFNVPPGLDSKIGTSQQIWPNFISIDSKGISGYREGSIRLTASYSEIWP